MKKLIISAMLFLAVATVNAAKTNGGNVNRAYVQDTTTPSRSPLHQDTMHNGKKMRNWPKGKKSWPSHDSTRTGTDSTRTPQ